MNLNKFTVIERDGCVIIVGALTLHSLRGVTAMAPAGAIMSPQLAQMLGANFALGLQEDVDALIAKVKPDADRVALLRRPAGLSEAAALWLASGERGASSETMFTHLTGVNVRRGGFMSHPHDPADVRRCMLLLEDVPELKEKFGSMCTVSEPWRRLVNSWDLITRTLIEEWGDIRNPTRGVAAERTYEIIKQATGR